MLKVAFLTPSLHIGGAEHWILTLAGSLQNAKPVAIIHGSDFGHPEMVRRAERLCPVHRARGKGLPAIKAAVDAGCQRADVLISWGMRDLKTLTADVDCARVEVSHSDGAWVDQTELVHQSYKGADFLAAVSKTALSAYPEAVRQYATVIYSGISMDRAGPHYGRDWQRQQWGAGDNDKVALFLGRLASVKGPERLIRAMPHLGPEWSAIFVGHGPDSPECQVLAERIAPGRCFFRPPVAHVGDLLAGADCLVMPSDCEGMPLSMVEAWAAGLPVATTRYGWIDEIEELIRSRSLAVPPFAVAESADGQDIAAAIMAADSGGDLPRGSAWHLAANLFTASAMAGRWETYLHHCVTRKREISMGLASPLPSGVDPIEEPTL